MDYKQFTFEYETQRGRKKTIRIIAKTVEEARGLWAAISADEDDPPGKDLVLYEPAIASKNASHRGGSHGPSGRHLGG